MSSLIKNILIFAVLAGVMYAGYYIFFSNNSSDLNIGGGVSEGELMAGEFLLRLNEIEKMSFSRDFFDDARFRSFVSFRVAPDTVSAGRPNPFSR